MSPPPFPGRRRWLEHQSFRQNLPSLGCGRLLNWADPCWPLLTSPGCPLSDRWPCDLKQQSLPPPIPTSDVCTGFYWAGLGGCEWQGCLKTEVEVLRGGDTTLLDRRDCCPFLTWGWGMEGVLNLSSLFFIASPTPTLPTSSRSTTALVPCCFEDIVHNPGSRFQTCKNWNTIFWTSDSEGRTLVLGRWQAFVSTSCLKNKLRLGWDPMCLLPPFGRGTKVLMVEILKRISQKFLDRHRTSSL